jgi:ketosteroid isomerase-like protein
MGQAVTRLIDRYFAAMCTRDAEALMALFAPDAVMVLPDGRELAGTTAIRAMYEHLLTTDPPTPAPMATIISSVGGATEIETRLGDGSSRQTANFFHLDKAGQIRRLSVYKRG